MTQQMTESTIPLSDAMMLGSTIPDAGCALEMAMKAIGGIGHWSEAVNHWPWLGKPIEMPCHCERTHYGFEHEPNKFNNATMAIAFMYDSHVKFKSSTVTWTFDQLVDWVRANEPQLVEANELGAIDGIPTRVTGATDRGPKHWTTIALAL